MKKVVKKKPSTEFSRVQDLIDLAKKNGVFELEYEKNGERIRISTSVRMAPIVSTERSGEVAAVSTGTGSAKNLVTENSREKKILSPLVGTFYRAAAPGADDFVKVGQTVKRGDVLCIVEAMKLMNEIESEFNGKIVSSIAENGQPVEFGEPLFTIEVS